MSRLIQVPDPGVWKPRGYQFAVWNYPQTGGKRADVVAHRRWGKDKLAMAWAGHAASQRVGNYWHLFPEAAQGRKALWEAVNPHTGKRRIEEMFPRAFRSGRSQADMRLVFDNGSTWQIAGSDQHDRLVGSSPAGVVFSEWSLSKPEAWTYIRPILAENDGWALFLWTPRGRNHATHAFEARARNPAGWFTQRAAATETGAFSPERLAQERTELMDEAGEAEGAAQFAQEYLVSFDAPSPGAYFTEALQGAEAAGRIGRLPVEPGVRVETAWDLGIADYTAIWFFQRVGREVRAIDYLEASGEGLGAIVAALDAKGYLYGAHHLPHDVRVRELGTGVSRVETLASLGCRDVRVGSPAQPADRVHAARQLIAVTWFDRERCALGLTRLRAYRKAWSRELSR